MSPAPAPARRLAAALEPIAGQAQFSPECQAAYETLGFDPSPGMVGSTVIPDRSAYFTARGSVLGDARPSVVVAAFGVFAPEVMTPLVVRGQQVAAADVMWEARQGGAAAQLRRVLGEHNAMGEVSQRLLAAVEALPVSGRPLFAGQRDLPLPDDPIGRLWRGCDMLREHRGDAHIVAWSAEGLNGLEVGLLGDLYWGLNSRGHTSGRGWTDDQMAAAEEDLARRGLLVDGGRSITPAGRDLRERIEARTDELMGPALTVLGDELDGIVNTMTPWGEALIATGAYLSPLVRFTF